MDPPGTRGKEIVRSGYDAIAREYAAARRQGEQELSLLHYFAARLPEGGDVLDAGCGAGVPVAQWLSRRFSVTGVDISSTQIELARHAVPDGRFLRADMTELDLPDGSFDGICSIYALIHVPREEQAPLLGSFRRMLRPGGVVLLCLGAGNLPNDVDDYFGLPMYWSHYDADTNLAMVRDAGFDVLRSELVPDILPDGTQGPCHLFVLGVVGHRHGA